MLETLGLMFSTICLALLPLGITVYFIVSLCRYISAKNANKKVANSYENYSFMTCRLHLLISAMLLVFTVLMVICTVVLMSGDISFM